MKSFSDFWAQCLKDFGFFFEALAKRQDYDKLRAAVEWGMDRIFFVLLLLNVLALSKEVLGGPTQPIAPAASSSTAGALQEISPNITDIIVKKGNPFIEVYISGSGQLACYDIREYDIQKTPSSTLIIPRLRRSTPNAPCEKEIQDFKDKVVDLDPSLEATYHIEVLGFKGWESRKLPKNL